MEEFEKCLNSALRFLSFRPRSEKEVRDRLLKKRVSSKTIEQVIIYLKEKDFLSDSKFVRWWIEQRLEFKPKGMRAIKMELRQKGIPSELIEEMLNNLQISNESELEKAKKLAEKKLQQLRLSEREEIVKKIGPFLMRRGFDYQTCKQVIDEIAKKRV